MVSSIEKINCKLVPIFKLIDLSQADSNFSFPGLLFPSFHVWPQPRLLCHWPPNRRTSSSPRFLTEYPRACWPAHPNSVHGLLLSFLLCEATQTTPTHTPLHTLLFSEPRVVSVHAVYWAIIYILPAFSFSSYTGTLRIIHLICYYLNFHVFLFCFITYTLSNHTFFTLLLKQKVAQGFSQNRLLEKI